MKYKRTWALFALLFAAITLWGFVAIVAAQATYTVEPDELSTQTGGTLSIYANADVFTNTYVVRLVGHGILQTTYINRRALQATVPAGVAAGQYDVRVLDGAGGETFVGEVRLVAPPTPKPTPKPEEPPPPGRPILTVRSYTINPPKVRPGQEFVVSAEIYNNGSRAGENTMAVFPGGTFIPVGNNGHLLWQVHINHTFVVTQRMRVPDTIGSGVHNLHIDLSANDWEGNHYDYPETLAVEVIGGTGSQVFTGRPKVVIEGAESTPSLVAPGSAFTLTLRLANRGSRTAINVTAGADSQQVVPAEGGSVVAADLIRIDESVTVTLPLILNPGQEGGRHALAIALDYSDYDGGNHHDQQSVGLNVDASLANQPQVLIQAQRTQPAMLSPGNSFTLTLTLVNVGGGDAQRLVLSLGGEGGEALGPFVPVEAGNVHFEPRLKAGETLPIAQHLLIDGQTTPKAYNLPVALAYDTPQGTRVQDIQRISLLVRRRIDFQISFYRPVEGTMVGQPFPLPIELVNLGNDRFTIPKLEATSQDAQLVEEASVFIGTLEAGGSWTLDTMAIAEQPGPAEIVVNVHYIDDLNETRVVSQVLTVDVMGAPEGPDATGKPMDAEATRRKTFWGQVGRFVKGFLGLGS